MEGQGASVWQWGRNLRGVRGCTSDRSGPVTGCDGRGTVDLTFILMHLIRLNDHNHGR